MPNKYIYHKIPRSRIASFDVYAVGLHKHHVPAMPEFDVTDSRNKLKAYRKGHGAASLNAGPVQECRPNCVRKHSFPELRLIPEMK